MSTLSRILKYSPALAMAVLAIVWWLSRYGAMAANIETWNDAEAHSVRFHISTFVVGWHRPYIVPAPQYKTFQWDRKAEPAKLADMAGTAAIVRLADGFLLLTPIPLLLTALLPLAVGPFLSFRFRLWHYLAYTALVALELAYYLRWQD